MPVVSVASAAAGHHRAEFPKGQRAGQREQTTEEPHEQHVGVCAQLVSEAAGGAKDARANHCGDDGAGGGPKAQWALVIFFAHLLAGEINDDSDDGND